MPSLSVNGINLNYRFDGTEGKPVLLFSNSLMSNLHMWDTQISKLESNFHILRYDSRGHGQSDAPKGDYTIDMLADDAIGLLDALGIEKAYYCGLSKGGMVGQKLATRNPERLHAAVFCATSSFMGPANLWQQRIDAAHAGGMESVSDGTLERWFTPSYHSTHASEIAKIREMIHATPVDGFAGCCIAIKDMDQRETIKTINLPVLVIAGAEDPGTTPAMNKLIADSIPGAEYVELPESAHFCNVQAADGFNTALADFLLKH